MFFPFLKFIKWTEMWIFVIKRYDIANISFIIFTMVEIRARWCICWSRPAICMHDKPRIIVLILKLPYFFKTYSIMLRVFTIIKLVFFNNFFSEMSSTAFTQNSIFSSNFYPWLMTRLKLSRCRYSHISSLNSNNLIILKY